jgi:site-specific DNA-methyltransferase (adenine-specific)
MIFNCDARNIPLPDKSINCVITSPPYYALRKYDIPDVIWDGDKNCDHDWEVRVAEKTMVTLPYEPGGSPRKKLKCIDDEGRAETPALDLTSSTCIKCGAWKGQLGCEPHYNDFVRHLCDIFDEVKRVLRDDGIIFVNLSDGYGGSGGDSGKKPGTQRKGPRGIDTRPVGIGGFGAPPSQKFTPKSLLGIPERFMLEMLERGWVLRNKIIWFKPNVLPHSVKDRFTVDFEPIFFFAKKKDYFFDQQFEPYEDITKWGMNKDGSYSGIGKKDYAVAEIQNPSDVKRRIIEGMNPLGRNKRCVWKIPTRGVKEAHFAIFPDDLVKPMILAGVPEYQCKKCGKPREKIYNSEYFGDFDTKIYKPRPDPRDSREFKEKNMGQYKKKLMELSDCGCGVGWEPGAVLDPFSGSGTTIRVAEKLGRRGFGCDLGYAEISSERVSNVQREWG